MKRPRRPKLKEPARAGDLVDKLLQGLGLDERLHQYKALVIWNDVVGPQIAARTKPVRIREGVLEVNVDQPAWMQQLHLMKPKIIAQLNSELGQQSVKDLYLKRGRIDARAGKQPEPPPAWRMVNLDDKEKQQIRELLASIEDEALRLRMETFLQKQTRLFKAKGNP